MLSFASTSKDLERMQHVFLCTCSSPVPDRVPTKRKHVQQLGEERKVSCCVVTWPVVSPVSLREVASPALSPVLQQLTALSALPTTPPVAEGRTGSATIRHTNTNRSVSFLLSSFCFKASSTCAETLRAARPPFSSHHQLSLCTELKRDCSTFDALSPHTNHCQKVDHPLLGSLWRF